MQFGVSDARSTRVREYGEFTPPQRSTPLAGAGADTCANRLPCSQGGSALMR